MDFSLTEPERDLVGLCREFAQHEIAKRAPLAWDEARCPTDLLREMGGLGLLGMLVPPEWDGAGADHIAYALAIEEVAAGDGACSTIMSVHNSVACMPILKFGTEAQKQTWLPDLCAGRTLGGFGLTEPEAGSDAGGTRTTATLDDAAGEWVIDGEKWFSSNFKYATFAIVMAVSDPDVSVYQGTSMFLVPTDTPGIEIIRNVGLSNDREGEARWTKAARIEALPEASDRIRILAIAAAAENVLLLALVFWRRRSLRRAFATLGRQPFMLYTLIVLAVGAIILSFNWNLGTLARHRTMVLPFLMMLLAGPGRRGTDDA